MIDSIQAANATVGAMISLTKNTLVLLIILVVVILLLGYFTGMYKPFAPSNNYIYIDNDDN